MVTILYDANIGEICKDLLKIIKKKRRVNNNGL